jgi:hypothetical protein
VFELPVMSDQSSGFVGEPGYARSGESSDQIDGREGGLPVWAACSRRTSSTTLGATSSWSRRKVSG